MHIKILGVGCAKCDEAKALAEKIVQELGLEATVEKVSDLKQIMALGVLSTPGVVVNGVVKCSGRVPGADELRQWLSA